MYSLVKTLKSLSFYYALIHIGLNFLYNNESIYRSFYEIFKSISVKSLWWVPHKTYLVKILVKMSGFQRFRNVFLYISRSSHWRCSVKKGVLKNFENFTGKHLSWSLFLRSVTLLIRDSNTGVFLWNLWNFTNICERLKSLNSWTIERSL